MCRLAVATRAERAGRPRTGCAVLTGCGRAYGLTTSGVARSGTGVAVAGAGSAGAGCGLGEATNGAASLLK